MNSCNYALEYSSYDVFVSRPGLGNLSIDYRVSCSNHALDLWVKCLAQGIKLSPLGNTKREVSYDD